MTTLYKKLKEIDKELKEIENPLKEGLEIKLKRTTDQYLKNIKANCKYILSRNNYKVMMSIDRYSKKKERDNNEEDKYGFIEVN